jgi:anaerobic selenocysteine-containing dehydrogenase
MVISLTQPVIEPQYNTRQTADVLLDLAREVGGDVADALPFESAKEIVEKSIANVVGKSQNADAEAGWQEFVARGVMVTNMEPPRDAADTAKNLSNKRPVEGLPAVTILGEDREYPLTAIIYESASHGDGSYANLPALQELPDPMTSVMWGSWVEINPRTAEALGIREGDLVEVQTRTGAVRLPASLFPGIRPDVIAMPFGQGHSAFGRYAKNMGASPAALFPMLERGSDLNFTMRARVVKSSDKGRLIRFGTDLQERMENRR